MRYEISKVSIFISLAFRMSHLNFAIFKTFIKLCLSEYLKSAGLPESLWSVDGSELLAEDDLSSAMSSSHSGVLKIVYEK